MNEVEEEKSDLKKDTDALKDIQDDLKGIKKLQEKEAWRFFSFRAIYPPNIRPKARQ